MPPTYRLLLGVTGLQGRPGLYSTDAVSVHWVCQKGLTADKRPSALCLCPPSCLFWPLSLWTRPANHIWEPGELAWVDCPLKHAIAICAHRKAEADYESDTPFGSCDSKPSARCVACTGTGRNNEPCKHTPVLCPAVMPLVLHKWASSVSVPGALFVSSQRCECVLFGNGEVPRSPCLSQVAGIPVQPWPGDILSWVILCCEGRCRMFSNIPSLYLLITSNPPPSHCKLWNQKCLQSLPNVPWVTKLLPVGNQLSKWLKICSFHYFTRYRTSVFRRTKTKI